MNVRDTEILKGLFLERGWNLADTAEEADCVLFNTCSVRAHAEERAYSNMGMLARFKKKKPSLVLGFIGCTARKDKERVRQRLPVVDLVAGPAELYDVPGHVECIRAEKRSIIAVARRVRPDNVGLAYRERRDAGYVSVSEGCSNFCSYCIVPFVRGRERSRKKAHILKEVRMLAGAGIQEVTLLGQNVNSYGNDLKSGYSFETLLRDIHDVEGIRRIRFVTCHPKDTRVSLFRTMRDLPKVHNHLHLPLQSGSARVLKAMKRGYTPAHYMKLVERLRAHIPECNLTTDIIVGFPGENARDFNNTYAMMKKIQFDSAYLFLYSPRPPAASSRYPDDVPQAEKKRRHAVLLELQRGIARRRRAARADTPLPMA